MNFLTTLGDIDQDLETKVCTQLNIPAPCHLSVLLTLKRRVKMLWDSLPEKTSLESILRGYEEYNLSIEEVILPPSKEDVRALVLEVFEQTHGITNPTTADLHYYTTTGDESFEQNLKDAGVSQKELELFWS